MVNMIAMKIFTESQYMISKQFLSLIQQFTSLKVQKGHNYGKYTNLLYILIAQNDGLEIITQRKQLIFKLFI